MDESRTTVGPPFRPRISNEQAALAERVERLESILVGFAALVGATCLILGELLPFVTFNLDGKPVTVSAASYGFAAVAYRDEDGATDGLTVVVGIAFLGLLVVVLASLAALRIIGLQVEKLGSRRWVGVVATLLVIGVIGVWLTAAVGSDQQQLHQGPFWLTAGAVVLAVLAGSRTAQALWVRP